MITASGIISIRYDENIVTIHHTLDFDINEIGIKYKLIASYDEYTIIDIG